MSADFKTILLKDDRIANLTDQIAYSVNKGAQQLTSAVYAANSQSPSSCVYNIQVPSLETVIDRHCQWTATVRLKLTGTSIARVVAGTGAVTTPGTQLLRYGVRDCLGAFPLHSMAQNMSVTINNNTVSCNMKDVLAPMLRMLSAEDLCKWNATTPTMYDQYLDYADQKDVNNNSFAGFENISHSRVRGRGSFAPDRISAHKENNTPLSHGGTTAYIEFTVTEPIMLSPFLFGGSKSNSGGMHGVQNLSFNFTMGYPNRVFRHTDMGAAPNVQTITNVEIDSITNSSIRLFFLTCHPSDQLSSRCVLPYYELPRYISNAVAIAHMDGAYTGKLGVKPVPIRARLASSTISLNQIPDKLLIFARKVGANWNDSDSFLSIAKVDINFNNNTSVCGSFSREDLWRCSVEAGSNQSWDEFRGYSFQASSEAETVNGSGAGRYIRTCGSVLMLDVGKHLNLVEDYYSPGSIGSFNLQVNCDVENYSHEQNQQYELIMITMLSGCFSIERGTSSIHTAMLTKDDVLQASMGQAISHSDHRRMVGSGFLDSLKGLFSWIGNNKKTLGDVARVGMDLHSMKSGRDYSGAKNVLSTLGAGRSGGGQSGGSLMSRLK